MEKECEEFSRLLKNFGKNVFKEHLNELLTHALSPPLTCTEAAFSSDSLDSESPRQSRPPNSV